MEAVRAGVGGTGEQTTLNVFHITLPDHIVQTLATGLDEDYKKPRGIADQVIRLLDEDAVIPPDRLRLLILYLLYRDGVFPGDLQKLLSHAQLSPQDAEVIQNLELVGARTTRNLKDSRPLPPTLFPQKPPPAMASQEEYSLSRYEPVLQKMLESHASNSLDAVVFPYTKPPLDMGNEDRKESATSLRSAKPTWARTRANVSTENRQRVMMFVAGGATYSEARACYEVGRVTNREICLVTSHMLTPSLFIRQIGDLSVEKRRLNIPMEMPKPKAPEHLFEPDAQPRPPQPHEQQKATQGPPTQAMGNISLNGRPNGGAQVPAPSSSANSSAKLTKDREPEKKKKSHFGFGKKS